MLLWTYNLRAPKGAGAPKQTGESATGYHLWERSEWEHPLGEIHPYSVGQLELRYSGGDFYWLLLGRPLHPGHWLAVYRPTLLSALRSSSQLWVLGKFDQIYSLPRLHVPDGSDAGDYNLAEFHVCRWLP